MKKLICLLSTFAVTSFAPHAASAADFGGYEERDSYVEERAPIVERERIIERRYYKPRYHEPSYYEEDEPVVTYYQPRYRRPFPYYANYNPYWRPRIHHWHHRYWERDGGW